MKLLLDESVDHRIRSVLDDLDVTTVSVVEVGLDDTRDEVILEEAGQQDMPLLSQDSDLVELARAADSHAGVVYVPQRIGFTEMKDRIRTFFTHVELEDLEGSEWYPKPSEAEE